MCTRVALTTGSSSAFFQRNSVLNRQAAKYFGDSLNVSQVQHAEQALWKAHIKMSSVFCNGTADGREILPAYSECLKGSQPSITPSEFKIAITLWFRQMMDYQVQAFSLWALLQFKKDSGERDKLPEVISKFHISLKEQIKKNIAYVDETLVYESQGYIAHQLEKSKTKRIGLNKLNISKEG